jgi:hypothetical protein
MAFAAGTAQKVTLGATTIVGMGNWELTGISVDLLESTAFGDTAKQFMTGLLDYGTVTFGGLYDLADTTGQTILMSALSNNSKIGILRLFVNSVSYWAASTGLLAGAGLLMQSVSIGADKSGLATVKFTGKCTGPWTLV